LRAALQAAGSEDLLVVLAMQLPDAVTTDRTATRTPISRSIFAQID
jgi:hypothetical protein